MYSGSFSLADGLTLRPAHDADHKFLASFQHEGDAPSPNDLYFIVIKEGERIGRAVIEHNPDEVCIKDISFISVAKRKGYTTTILHALQYVASTIKTPLSLVLSDKVKRSLKRYSNLGFQLEQRAPGIELLTWRPAPSRVAT